jgi:Myb superfamily proteins, including transcription factors and mRNA splicing factors
MEVIFMEDIQNQSVNQKYKSYKRREKFTSEEDQKILDLVKIHGTNNWALIARAIQKRTGKQCRDRYYNYLAPNINHNPISAGEYETIYIKYKEIGSKWLKIAKFLQPGRTENQVKNAYKRILRASNKLNIILENSQLRQKLIQKIHEKSIPYKPPLKTHKTINYRQLIMPQIQLPVFETQETKNPPKHSFDLDILSETSNNQFQSETQNSTITAVQELSPLETLTLDSFEPLPMQSLLSFQSETQNINSFHHMIESANIEEDNYNQSIIPQIQPQNLENLFDFNQPTMYESDSSSNLIIDNDSLISTDKTQPTMYQPKIQERISMQERIKSAIENADIYNNDYNNNEQTQHSNSFFNLEL